jgi:hypothetical protein
MAGILKVDRIQEANSGQGVELSHKLVDTSGNTIISENNGVATFGSSVAPSTNYTFRNKIINGNLKSARVINQRGASSITGATGYTYDRWYYDGSTYLYQGIEDLNVNNGTYCVSWVGSDITAQYLLSTDSTKNNGWDGAGTFQTVANGGTFTVNESPEHGKHLWIRFSGTLSNLDKVMVEEGTVATPFEHRLYGVELALCQRYYQKSYDIETAPGTDVTASYIGLHTGNGVTDTATNQNVSFTIHVNPTMRAQPTFYYYSLEGTLNRYNTFTAGGMTRSETATTLGGFWRGVNSISGYTAPGASQLYGFCYVLTAEL